ncbi:type II toxin-antitoxin system RelE/ParE family toxin [Flavobacterium sp. MFBS3-15]|uniref:type II toxin-antitoxin system RelE/ParE family toxin n=1 Tax=Flavobacterium sp. MFBS3-15 TaxID=2989816 RepID=UPI002235FFF9|nr:type II toxin-antitoxin system RelE/ParE family toxin [Flavobacterium sp. MFBS3-15]MCW4467500.1 type II toxin-antitoxin system RelE/ParE family toxin [Flavobacterium sp. MFBS3-15]
MRKKHKFFYSSHTNRSVMKAFDYYESVQKDLGDYFILSLEKCLASIDNNPEIFKIIHKNFRQAKVPKFPYIVLYRIIDTGIIIDNVFNTYRNPIKKIR